MLKLVFEDGAYLLVYDAVVLGYEVYVIAVLAVLAEEGGPFKAVFPVPCAGVEELLALVQHEEGLVLHNLPPRVALMELQGEVIQAVQVAVAGALFICAAKPEGVGLIDELPHPSGAPPPVDHGLVHLEVGYDVPAEAQVMVDDLGHMQALAVAGLAGHEVYQKYHRLSKNKVKTASDKKLCYICCLCYTGYQYVDDLFNRKVNIIQGDAGKPAKHYV